jgi:hypothetical protein
MSLIYYNFCSFSPKYLFSRKTYFFFLTQIKKVQCPKDKVSSARTEMEAIFPKPPHRVTPAWPGREQSRGRPEIFAGERNTSPAAQFSRPPEMPGLLRGAAPMPTTSTDRGLHRRTEKTSFRVEWHRIWRRGHEDPLAPPPCSSASPASPPRVGVRDRASGEIGVQERDGRRGETAG